MSQQPPSFFTVPARISVPSPFALSTQRSAQPAPGFTAAAAAARAVASTALQSAAAAVAHDAPAPRMPSPVLPVVQADPSPRTPSPAPLVHAAPTPAPVVVRRSLAELRSETATQVREIGPVIDLLQTLKRALSELETSTDANRESKKQEVTGIITSLLASCPVLKTVIANAVNDSFNVATPVTPETIQLHLTDHCTQLNAIIDPLGNSLIDILVRKFSEQLNQTETLEKLYTLKQAITEETYNPPAAERAYDNLPPTVKGDLAYAVWQRNGQRQDGERLIRTNPRVALNQAPFTHSERIPPIDIQINQTVNRVSALAEEVSRPITVLRQDVSAERLQLRVKGNQLNVQREQLEKFNTALKTSGTTKEVILDMFHKLPDDVKGALPKLVWYADGQPILADHGMITIQNHPWIFLDIRNSDGQNIIEQLALDTAIQFKATILKDALIALRDTATAPAQADAFRGEFARVQAQYPDLCSEIAGKIWARDRSRHDPANENFGGWGYGERTLLENPATLLDIREGEANILGELLHLMTRKIDQNLLTIIDRPERRNTSAAFLGTAAQTAARVADYAPKRVAMISAEFKSSVTVSEGGLGEAVRGMVIGHGKDNVCVIMPKFDILKVPADRMERTAHTVYGHAVFKAMVDDIECFFIEDNEFFNVGTSNGANNTIYGDDARTKTRYAKFQMYAAELARKFYRGEEESRKIDVVHLQDSQTALIPTIYTQKHTTAWLAGETPPTVFTYHNNGVSAQNIYYDEPGNLGSIRDIGLTPHGYNSFMEGLANADAVTTVSQKFAEESSGNGVLGRGVGPSVRKAIYDGKLYDVLNGNTLGWNPKAHPVLTAWTAVDTLDLADDAEVVHLPFQIEPTDLIGENAQLINDQILGRCLTYKDSIQREIDAGKKVVMDLTYGPGDHPLVIDFKKQLCKEQVALYLAKYRDGFNVPFGQIDPNKPLLLSLGRLDPSQKGIGKLPLIMETALANEAQMIVIGLDGEKAQSAMEPIHEVATRNQRNGAAFIQDERVTLQKWDPVAQAVKTTTGPKWQVGHNIVGADGQVVLDSAGHPKVIPGIGPLLRAAADIFVAPSEYEPCGLTQGESFEMGTRVLATDTGGFHDTVFTEGVRQNGWRFDRHEDWNSDAQNDAIRAKVTEAIAEVKGALYPDPAVEPVTASHAKVAFHTQTQKIMTDAKHSTWTQTPDGSPSPIDKMRAVYDLAIARQQERVRNGGRGYAHFDLGTARGIEII